MTDKKNAADKRVSLAPLDFEKALGGILQAGPHAEDKDDASQSDKQHSDLSSKERQ